MDDPYKDERGPTLDECEPDWDYSSPYCDGCAELGMTTCSCEEDGYEDD